MSSVRELTKDPLVKSVSQLLRDVQAKRVRCVAVVYELQTGEQKFDFLGDPPVNFDEFLVSISYLLHEMIGAEEKREHEAEDAAEEA